MRTLIVIALVACLCGSVYSQDSLNVSLAGSLYNIWDEARDVVVRQNYAYVTAGNAGLRILDISNPEAPVELGYCDTPEDAETLELQGNYAYVADWERTLWIIDISDPAEPTQVGVFDTGDAAYGEPGNGQNG